MSAGTPDERSEEALPDADCSALPVLDPCCGPRMWWFDKSHPAAVFGDARRETEQPDWREWPTDSLAKSVGRTPR
jgi:hypothetical protein